MKTVDIGGKTCTFYNKCFFSVIRTSGMEINSHPCQLTKTLLLDRRGFKQYNRDEKTSNIGRASATAVAVGESETTKWDVVRRETANEQ